MSSVDIFSLALPGLGALLVVASIKVVPQGRQYRVRCWGQPDRYLDPGLHIIRPLLDRIIERIPA